jgi:carboxymethylenebutenolidase
MDTVLSSAQKISDLWDEHLRDEFAIKDAAAAADTMVADAYVNHVPVLTGGVGNARVKEPYSKHFIPKMPSDWEILSISRQLATSEWSKKWSFVSPILSKWIGCCRAFLRPTNP